MTTVRAIWRLTLAVALALVLADAALAITPGQIDDFQDGTTMGWSHGSPSPIPPVHVADGGPLGAGDGYVDNRSSGEFGPGSRMAFFNRAQWSGNYIDAAVIGIEMDIANFGDQALSIRIGLEGANTRFASTNGQMLAADGTWQRMTFAIDDTGLTRISGIQNLDTALADVFELRIISAASGPAFAGDIIAGQIGVDNITTIVDVQTTSGEVPNGASTPGPPLLVDRDTLANELLLRWGASCSALDTDYQVYQAPMRQFNDFLPRLCTTAGELTTTIPIPEDGTMFLIVPTQGTVEGSYGTDSSGTPRVASPLACLPQAIGVCPL